MGVKPCRGARTLVPDDVYNHDHDNDDHDDDNYDLTCIGEDVSVPQPWFSNWLHLLSGS